MLKHRPSTGSRKTGGMRAGPAGRARPHRPSEGVGRADRPEEIQGHQDAAYGTKEHESGGQEQRRTLHGARVLVSRVAGRPRATRVPNEGAVNMIPAAFSSFPSSSLGTHLREAPASPGAKQSFVESGFPSRSLGTRGKPRIATDTGAANLVLLPLHLAVGLPDCHTNRLTPGVGIG